MDSEPMDDEVRTPAPAEADTEADVEGHSVFGAIAASGALRPHSPRDDQAARRKADEDLPPLSKPFPSMRDERRK